MEYLIESLFFFWQQIIIAILLGSVLAGLGVFVLLGRMAVFGVTLSQASTVSVALGLIFGYNGHAEWLIFPLTVLLMLPFFLLQIRRPHNLEAILIGGLVLFVALSQFLLAFGGNVKNHLVAAYFGDIVLIRPGLFVPVALFLFFSTALFFLRRPLTLIFFDADQARLRGLPVRRLEFLFFLLLSSVTVFTISYMGSFYSIAHMIVPGLFALSYARSPLAAIFIAAALSAFASGAGFIISLLPFSFRGEDVLLPTSSLVILILIVPVAVRLFLPLRK